MNVGTEDARGPRATKLRAVCLIVIALATLLISGCSREPRAAEAAKQVGVVAPERKYEGKLIRLDGGTADESAKVYVVNAGKKHWVTSIEWIKGHGFKWPDDLIAVPRSEFSAIPDGDPIFDPK